MATLVIDNFGGRLDSHDYGDINSGIAKRLVTYGSDPFTRPGALRWQEGGTQIDLGASVITDLIMAGKERMESGISYVYAVGHTGRVYKIQVNKPSTSDPNFDTPVLLTTITIGSPTFTQGGFIDFYGSTERIYIGHDKGVTQLDFAGTNETVVGSAVSWTASVPRPLKQFLGNLYAGNGSNIAEIIPGLTVSTYTKLSPGFPNNTNVRDIDLASDGNYLDIVVSRLALPDQTSVTVDTTSVANSESYIFKWNGTDVGYTAFTSYPSFSLTSNWVFGPYQYTFGNDIAGSAVFDGSEKILSLIIANPPLPNAMGSNGNLMGWASVEYFNGYLRMVQYLYGSVDKTVGIGWWKQFAQSATSPETDIIRIPFALLVTNFSIGSSSSGYTANFTSYGKGYFSTLETSSGTTKYKFYKWNLIPTALGTPITGIYETQTQVFSKKVKVQEVRVYGVTWVAGNGFQIDLIDSSGNVISGSTKTFTAGSNLTVGADFAWYTPIMAPTYGLALRVTQTGTTHHQIIKIEIDYESAGK